MFVWVLVPFCTVVQAVKCASIITNILPAKFPSPGEFNTHYFGIGAAPLFLLWVLIGFGFDLEGAIAVDARQSSEKLSQKTCSSLLILGTPPSLPQASRRSLGTLDYGISTYL